MRITLNNKTEEIEGHDEITVQELLDLKRFTFKLLVVKINGKVVKKKDYNKAVIRNNDNVSVIHLLAGG